MREEKLNPLCSVRDATKSALLLTGAFQEKTVSVAMPTL